MSGVTPPASRVGGGVIQDNRIEYIDAMRGFTILLVVMCHISYYVLLQTMDCYSLNQTFALFRMPLFFFVSGFVLYKAGRKWDWTEICQFLKKKITVQVLSPLIFMIVISRIFPFGFVGMLFLDFKGGYWFTFALFEFFVIYIIIQQVLRLIKNDRINDTALLFIGVALSAVVLTINTRFGDIGENSIYRLFGVCHLHHFMFFVIGTLVRKHYKVVESFLDKKYTVAVLLTLFVALCILRSSGGWYTKSTGLIGVFLVLSIFRRYRDTLSKSTKVGFVLQFVGRRTLDIYLLHYFFVWSNLTAVFPDFGVLQSPFVEFIVSFLVAVVIIACCLLVSAVIRTSPFLAHFLFGQKYSR